MELLHILENICYHMFGRLYHTQDFFMMDRDIRINIFHHAYIQCLHTLNDIYSNMFFHQCHKQANCKKWNIYILYFFICIDPHRPDHHLIHTLAHTNSSMLHWKCYKLVCIHLDNYSSIFLIQSRYKNFAE